MVESKTCSVLPLENLRAIQCMRRLSLSRSIIDTYKYQNRVLKTFYYNLNHIEVTEMDELDQLIIDELEKHGKEVFHIFRSRGVIEHVPNNKEWIMRRAYVFINKVSNEPSIHINSHAEVEQGVLDSFIICEPIDTEKFGILENGVFSTINLARIKNLSGEEKVIWNFEEV